jgi:hypothetical protein
MGREETWLEPVEFYEGATEREDATSGLMDLYVSGLRFEFWEDPDRPFGCAPADLDAYLERKAWVLLFNAVSLTKRHVPSEIGS